MWISTLVLSLVGNLGQVNASLWASPLAHGSVEEEFRDCSPLSQDARDMAVLFRILASGLGTQLSTWEMLKKYFRKDERVSYLVSW